MPISECGGGKKQEKVTQEFTEIGEDWILTGSGIGVQAKFN